jgi:AraC-like DNA-binding protein
MIATDSLLLEEFIDLSGDLQISYQKRAAGFWSPLDFSEPAFFMPRCASVFAMREKGASTEIKIDSYMVAIVLPGSNIECYGNSSVSDGVLFSPRKELIQKTASTFGLTIDFGKLVHKPVTTLSRTNWLNEIMHRYVYERVIARRSDSIATRFLEQEIVKEFYFRVIEHNELKKSRFDIDMRATDLRSPLLREAMTFIEANIFRDISIEDIVRKTGVSESTLLREFKERLGTSPSVYITVRRLEEAMLLLKGQTYSISQISDIVGYENVSAFSAAFKKHFGVTPSQVIVKDPAKLVRD